jgi:hypothetical protein
MSKAFPLLNKKIYISGPMTGIEQLNFPAFARAAKFLRDAGATVSAPHEIAMKYPESWEKCMAEDIKALCDCEAVFMLDGWEKSKGAHLELHIAHRLNLEIFFERG